jgi:hypothetical protein
MIKSLKLSISNLEKINQHMLMANLYHMLKIQELQEPTHMIKSLKLSISNLEKINQHMLMANLFLMLNERNQQ